MSLNSVYAAVIALAALGGLFIMTIPRNGPRQGEDADRQLTRCQRENINPSWIFSMHPWSSVKGNYSQSGQDHYLAKTFAVIGTTNKYFVEFGFNEASYTTGGSGPNTRALFEKGWRGLLLDADNENLGINLRKHYLFANNIANIFEKYGVPKELDYLSCDMDSHDLWVLRAILEAGYRPRVMTTEYNPVYPLSHAITLVDPTMLGNGSLPENFKFEFAQCAGGASAKALQMVASTHGYLLIGRVGELDLVWLREDLLDTCYSLPDFEWYFINFRLGSMYHPRASMKHVDQLVEYGTFLKTGDLAESNRAARKVLRHSKLECFANVQNKL